MRTQLEYPAKALRLAVAAAAIGFALLVPSTGRAGIIITVGSGSAASPSTGNSFDVLLQNTGPAAISVSSFGFQVNTADTDITFTSANISTVSPYIFAGHSLFGPVISVDSGQTLDASDLYDSGAVTIASGATVGLGHVFFDIAPGATSGPFDVTLGVDPATSLSDANGDSISIDSLVQGQITVEGGTVPEPAGFGLAGGALLAMLLRFRRVRR